MEVQGTKQERFPGFQLPFGLDCFEVFWGWFPIKPQDCWRMSTTADGYQAAIWIDLGLHHRPKNGRGLLPLKALLAGADGCVVAINVGPMLKSPFSKAAPLWDFCMVFKGSPMLRHTQLTTPQLWKSALSRFTEGVPLARRNGSKAKWPTSMACSQIAYPVRISALIVSCVK